MLPAADSTSGAVFDENKHEGNYASVKRITTQGTDQDGKNTAAVTITFFLLGHHPHESNTLCGAHDCISGTRKAVHARWDIEPG